MFRLFKEKSSPSDGFIPAPGAMLFEQSARIYAEPKKTSPSKKEVFLERSYRKTDRFVSCSDKEIK